MLDLAASRPARGDTAVPPVRRDPVCGMALGRSEPAIDLAFEGVTYWFCSAACRERFRVDQRRYLATPS